MGRSFYDDFISQLHFIYENEYNSNLTKVANQADTYAGTIRRLLEGDRSKHFAKIGSIADKLGIELKEYKNRRKENNKGDLEGILQKYEQIPIITFRTLLDLRPITPDFHDDYFLIRKKSIQNVLHHDNLYVLRKDEVYRNSFQYGSNIQDGFLLVNIIDKEIKNFPYNLYVIREPEDKNTNMIKGKICRIQIQIVNNEWYLICYGNVEKQEILIYSLREHYGNRIENAIVGRIVWGCSNHSHPF